MKPELALALIMKRWKDWQNVVHHQLPSQQQAERLNFIRLYKLYKGMKENETKDNPRENSSSNKRKARVCSKDEVSVKRIKVDGSEYPLVIGQRPIPHEQYFEYIRMDIETYFELFKLVEPKIKKQLWVKTPVPPHLRLQVCLRYLASGESMLAISYEFEIAPNTVSKIVTETCQVIYDVLKDLVFPSIDEEMWKEKAQEFESQLEFPHCVGAIGGKQLVFQSPFYEASKEGKDKGSLSFFAIVDVNCRFTLFSIRRENVINKSIVFSKSQVGRDLQTNAYDFPSSSEPSQKNPSLPYVLVGSKDFPLTNNVLQPYPTSQTADLTEHTFNLKVESVRQSAKSAFDVLTSQWKVFQKKISTNAVNTTKIVKAIACLHNFLMNKEIMKVKEDRQYAVIVEKVLMGDHLQGCTDVLLHPEEPRTEAVSVREKFKKHFCQTQNLT